MDDFVGHTINSGWQNLAKEFQRIRKDLPLAEDVECVAWKNNMDRNRYNNVKCLDSTRVVLTHNVPPEPDYINANYIRIKSLNRYFIATQGPLQNTADDFWRMVYQVAKDGCPAIFMLCEFNECGHEKCYPYWPIEQDGVDEYRNMTVTNLKQETFHNYLISKLEVQPNGSQNSVVATLYSNFNWPDGDIPADPRRLLKLLKHIREDTTMSGPWIVHCSAGRGRTGTLIAIEICLERLIIGKRASVRRIVRKIRKKRTQLVTKREQYVFIFSVVIEHCHNRKNCAAVREFQASFRTAYQADLL